MSSKAEMRLMSAIFGANHINEHGVLPSSGLDRLPVKKQRELLIAWSRKLVSHIEERTKFIHEKGTSQRVRDMIRTFASCHGRI